MVLYRYRKTPRYKNTDISTASTKLKKNHNMSFAIRLKTFCLKALFIYESQPFASIKL